MSSLARPLAIPTVQPATADPIGATRAQISAAQAQIETGAAQVHTLTVAFQQANLQATTLGQQVHADQAQIDQLQGRVSGSAEHPAPAGPAQLHGRDPLQSRRRRPGLGPLSRDRSTCRWPTGNLDDDLDQFRAQQRQLPAPRPSLIRQQRLEPGGRGRRTPRPGQQALAAAAGEQARLDQLQTQLNRYVEAAAVAAQQRAAAARAAARRPRRRSGPSSPDRRRPLPPTAASGSQGLPVNGGLVSVVHAIVSAPAPTSTPAPPAPPPAGRSGCACRWRVAAAARVRVGRQLRREHRQRLLRRLSVQRRHLDRPRLSRPARPGVTIRCRTRPPCGSRPSPAGGSGRPARRRWA